MVQLFIYWPTSRNNEIAAPKAIDINFSFVATPTAPLSVGVSPSGSTGGKVDGLGVGALVGFIVGAFETVGAGERVGASVGGSFGPKAPKRPSPPTHVSFTPEMTKGVLVTTLTAGTLSDKQNPHQYQSLRNFCS